MLTGIPGRWRSAAWSIALLIVVAYGALLRLDAYTGRYGSLSRPRWARIVTRDVSPLAQHLRPGTVAWGRVASPYVGGDPINYIKYGREMTSFYQPHVREPVFLAATRAGLVLLDGQDAGVSLASAVGSLLVVVGIYLLAAEVVSPAAGLAAALVMAIDYDMIGWAPDGWRDDMFTATVAFAAWAFVRFHGRPSFGNALLVGVTSGLSCLTRITALSFVVPALAWVAVAVAEPSKRPRREYAAVALVVLAAVVAPYLISCAIATGDPFFSINYHTSYYRFAEGMPATEPMSVGGYLRAKAASRPLATLDAGVTGEFVRPFALKWAGLSIWSAWIADALRWLSLAGLLGLMFSRRGRLLLVILLGSLVPYAFTWNVGAGGEWRFTMHAYPLYVVAALMVIGAVPRALRRVRQPFARWRRDGVAVAIKAAAVGAAAALAAAAYSALPWFVVREAVVNRESVSVEAGGRDGWFYRAGWSGAHQDGLAMVRVSTAPRASVHFPLAGARRYDLVLRVDPVAPEAQQRLTVLFNQQLVLRSPLEWNPQRVGAYRLRLPPEWIKTGDNELTLIPEPVVAARAAGPRFAWLGPSDLIGVRLWYVRVLPLAAADAAP